MLITTRKKLKPFCFVVLFSILYQILFPTIAFALTGGPKQPEVETFSPISSNNMVDLFSGDFKYNIPLIQVGDYPINLIYNSNPTMDQEASWVGLGWNINPGSLNRQMRGLPDDFKSDTILKEFNMTDNKTWGVNVGPILKVAGQSQPSLGLSIGANSNNYRGVGVTLGVTPTLACSKPGGGSRTASLGFQFSSQDGVSISAEAGIQKEDCNNISIANSIGLTYNTRAGLKELSLSSSANRNYISNGIASASLSFGYPTFTPTINMPLENNSFTISGSLGGEYFVIHPNMTLTGYWAIQSLRSHYRKIASFGYLNSTKGSKNIHGLLDYNREKDIPYNKSIPCLPIPNFTYDLFSATGEGMSGQFRAYRGDIGILFDQYTNSSSTSTDAGIQLGFGPNIVHGGGHINQVYVNTNSRKWNEGNALGSSMEFIDTIHDYPDFENNYFKNSGEFNLSDTALFHKVGDEHPVRNELTPLDFPGIGNLPLLEKFSNRSGAPLDTIIANQQVFRASRDRRTQFFSYLNTDEAANFGLDKNLLLFTPNALCYSEHCPDIVTSGRGHGEIRYPFVNYRILPRYCHQSHHISEVSIAKPDGRRYVYGIPAYNNFQKEVTFACQDLGTDPANGLVDYSSTDNSIGNTRGIDHYYSSERTPGYAYSYLLSGILSPDYMDRTENGVTSDDKGEGIRFNYSRIDSTYLWRVPYELNKANYNGGLHSGNGSPASHVQGDAKGTYIFGSKELWYMHSIESKTMVVQFYIEDREDALGVQGENGGLSTDTAQWHHQKLLREIKLFSKSDIIKYGSNAIPIKTVHFVYDYSLCQGVPNNSNVNEDNTDNHKPYYTDTFIYNQGGKLTLKKLYFTYGNNTKGQLNSYRLHYSTFNPSYGIKNYDRWGNYKNNSDASLWASNAEFPYTIQDKSLTDNYATAWNINSIDLPSGGTINVNLEADDYSYVQNKRAGQMFFVSEFGKLESSLVTGMGRQLYTDDGENNNVIIIKVDDTSGDFRHKYFDGLDYIFYRINTDVGSTSQYDYIAGYAKIDKSDDNWCGVFNSNSIWVKIEMNGGNNPISKQGWQFLRTYFPEIAYPGSNDPGNNLADAIVGLVSNITDIRTLIEGFPRLAKNNHWAQRFDPSKSFVRLNNPGHNKLGGGSRVKSIVISDNWGDMAPSGISKVYGQEYLYADTSNGITISTGVASWEPVIGNDENPFKLPVNYSVSKPLAEDDEYYMEEPFGESFFPSPMVGYEKVLIANFSNEHIRRTATGYKEVQFYTAKDFPVIVSRTGVEARKIKPPFRLTFLGSAYSNEKWLVSQGYSVELNDMHGKEKSTKISNAFGAEISSVYNHYTTEAFNGYQRLNNSADIILPNGEIRKGTIGEDIDFCMDMREQNTNTEGGGMDVNIEGMLIPFLIPFFLVIPPIIPQYTNEKLQFRSSVAMKVIHKYGVLEKVIATKDGSTIETKNLLHDSETGDVLLTQTQNEFNDPIYNWTYPAHWAYPNMGPAFINTGFSLRNVQINNGVIITTVNVPSYLREGDEVAIYKNGQALFRSTFSIAKIDFSDYRVMSESKLLTVKDSLSNLITVDMKIIRSGRRNMASLPIGNVSMVKIPPIDSSSHTIDFSNASYIINADANEFKDKWKVNCTDWITLSCDTTAPEFCLSHFINSILNFNSNHNFNQNLFYSCYSDSFSVANIFNFCECICSPDSIDNQPVDGMSFYNPVCWERGPKDMLVLQFGEGCKLIMQSLSGNPIILDSLQPISPLGSDTSQVKVYVGKNHTDSVTFSIQCISCRDSCTSIAQNFVNPYRTGLGNNWHNYKNWNYFTNRTEQPLADIRIRDKGYYKNFTPFWQYSDSIWNNNNALNDPNWISKNTVTRIIASGSEVENKDALNNYSSALYGYNESLAKAIASNARYKEIANDNFEDYGFIDNCSWPCIVRHWNFVDALVDTSVYISSAQSHTGKSSLFINDSSSASVYRIISYDQEDTLYSTDLTNRIFTMKDGCMERFSPDSGKYILSAWVKENGICGPVGYSEDSIKISFANSAVVKYLYPSGMVIEGWQRYEETFDVPSEATGITIKLCTGTNSAFFDDIRVHPYHSNMKAFVYDPRSMRLMSELDANNYASFYEYDDEGKLVRIKKETERGIMTLKETRVAYKKQ